MFFESWMHWLTSLNPDELLWAFAPILMLEAPRYAVGTLALWIVDFTSDCWDRLLGRHEAERFTYQPRCCAIVAGLNEADSLGQTLESLAGAYPDLQIVVVDDGSTDGMSTVASKFARTHDNTTVVRKPERGGKSSALNAALPFTDAEILICVDSDSHLGEGAVWEIVQPFADPRVGAVSGTVLVRNPYVNLLTWIQALEYYRCIFLGRMFTSRLGILGIISGAFGAYRREALLQVGAWDVGPGEDGDLTLRLRRAGYDIAFAAYAQCFTNPVQKMKVLTKQRRRWEWAVITLECRKHIDLANPFQAAFRWSNFVMLIDRWLYSIVLQYVFVGFLIWVMFNYDAFILYQLFLCYLAYLVMEMMQILILLYYCDNRKEILKIGTVFPVMPFYYLCMRFVTLWAITEEIINRRSYQDNFVPERVRKVTWHW